MNRTRTENSIRPVAPEEFPLALAGSDVDPLFQRIARTVTAEIRRGRLRPGALLPGTRSLAATLGVHRNTVLAAFRELEAEGWIRTEPARGTFVSDELPVLRPRRFAPAARAGGLGFDLDPVTVEPEPPSSVIALEGGIPDVRLVPVDALAREVRRALRRRRCLEYGDPRGEAGLRGALAAHLGTTRGLSLDADDLVVTRGSQMAIDLLSRVLLRSGDVVAVERWGYRPAWEALARGGATLVPLPVDEDGLDVAALALLASTRPVRAVYLTPHHQYPTTATLVAARRLALLDLARRHRIAVIEDDYDHEFHYEGRPILPLASADDAGVVSYVGTLSKVLAPGLRIGYLAGPRRLLDAVAAERRKVDRQGDHAMEAAVGALLRDGELQRHVRRMRRAYRARRDAMVAALQADLGEVARFVVPPGGMALWLDVGVDVGAWAARALERGVAFSTGHRYAFDGRGDNHVRLGFAAHDEATLRRAVRILRDALPR